MTNGSERIAEHPTGTATWLPVVGYEGLYEVSDDGRVRSIRAGKVLSPAPNPHGKLHVSLSRDGRPRPTVRKVIPTTRRTQS